MYFWISIVWMFRPSVCFFHYVHRFFLKYKNTVFSWTVVPVLTTHTHTLWLDTLYISMCWEVQLNGEWGGATRTDYIIGRLTLTGEDLTILRWRWAHWPPPPAHSPPRGKIWSAVNVLSTTCRFDEVFKAQRWRSGDGLCPKHRVKIL